MGDEVDLRLGLGSAEAATRLARDGPTDTLSAVALGAEPPAGRVLEQPPVSGRLLDRIVARRAFGVVGPTVAATAMAAFVVSFAAAGWRPGGPFRRAKSPLPRRAPRS
jgi:hypothetical protein